MDRKVSQVVQTIPQLTIRVQLLLARKGEGKRKL